MYIYNVTTNVADDIHEDWLLWMKESYIPQMLATGKFSGAKMSRVMIQEEMGGKTYSVQYAVKDRDTFKSFYVENASKMNAKMQSKFENGQTVSFQTELEVIGDFY
ncbi:hypothetical protein AXE80_00875 [Wenyingzhuangia fucanilytica]|uniref:DUF4286 domain-containing protein n=1 Tax=Wenyingzhuangia fucanilytica TaxID=1790137 RepID=A0A1B1Y2E0_9FLAO|nr:DUF4286 family protein [Wenyingzhuangia fucanilytica]ANW94933.1 hypothetical protein AXE80_00875 [Wenyingzhuangia fucanilytica]